MDTPPTHPTMKLTKTGAQTSRSCHKKAHTSQIQSLQVWVAVRMAPKSTWQPCLMRMLQLPIWRPIRTIWALRSWRKLKVTHRVCSRRRWRTWYRVPTGTNSLMHVMRSDVYASSIKILLSNMEQLCTLWWSICANCQTPCDHLLQRLLWLLCVTCSTSWNGAWNLT